MKTQYIYKVVLLSMLIVMISCGSEKKQNVESEASGVEGIQLIKVTNTQFQTSQMQLGKVVKHDFSDRIRTNGFIDVPPANKAKVSAVIGGFVKKSPLLVGDKVVKGQLLLTLENPEFIQLQQQYLEIFEKLSFLKSESDRQKVLFEEKIASEKNYLKAASDYKSALATFKGLEKQLQMLRFDPAAVLDGTIRSTTGVYAPISGSITKILANVGEFKVSSEVLLEIVNNDHSHLELTVFEKDVLSVKVGQPVQFNIPEASNEVFLAEVYLVGTSISDERTVTVHGHLENESEALLVGMFVEADIIVNTNSKDAVPASSLIEEDGSYSVLVLRERDETSYTFEKVLVQIGKIEEDWIELLDITKLQGAEILTKGAFLPLN